MAEENEIQISVCNDCGFSSNEKDFFDEDSEDMVCPECGGDNCVYQM